MVGWDDLVLPPVQRRCSVSRTHDVTISAFDLDRLEAELEAERSLADRLANELLNTLSAWIIERDAEQAVKALAAWKEARSERR